MLFAVAGCKDSLQPEVVAAPAKAFLNVPIVDVHKAVELLPELPGRCLRVLLLCDGRPAGEEGRPATDFSQPEFLLRAGEEYSALFSGKSLLLLAPPKLTQGQQPGPVLPTADLMAALTNNELSIHSQQRVRRVYGSAAAPYIRHVNACTSSGELATKQCSRRCHHAYYCGPECQKANWRQHKAH